MFSSPVAEMMSVVLPSRKQQVAENTLLKVDWMMIDDKMMFNVICTLTMEW